MSARHTEFVFLPILEQSGEVVMLERVAIGSRLSVWTTSREGPEVRSVTETSSNQLEQGATMVGCKPPQVWSFDPCLLVAKSSSSPLLLPLTRHPLLTAMPHEVTSRSVSQLLS